MSLEERSFVEIEEKPRSAHLEFIYCNHLPENLSKVIDALIESDGDIIALEKISEGTFGSGTSEDKRQLSEQMTEFLGAGAQIEETAKEYFPGANFLFTELLDRLKGTGKRIAIIDLGTDDPRYDVYKEWVRLREYNASKFDDYKRGDVSAEEMRGLIHIGRIAMVQSFEYREHVMENQLRELALDNPNSKITIMMGASHTPVYHHMTKTNDVSRKFVPSDEDKASYPRGVKFLYDYTLEARKLRFNLGKLGLSVIEPQ